ncbi:unnamed protein product [Didymodactylos carnosus]|uniref:Uncharacterized protein n=1 Tax=Didymodactylos carnosus TaxID=1234261 RepID=A0A8S2E766_9BILA|nr:unnamed protein product [Didymodactylos carnosus]CAF3849599.1 unnamed protein product [Didymodactylos carnosus]
MIPYPILKLGNKRQLTDNDLLELSPDDNCLQLLNFFESERVKRINNGTLKLIFFTFWREMLVSGLFLIPYSAAKIAQPLLLRQIILIITNPHELSYKGYLYAVVLGIASVTQALVHQQFFFRTSRVGMHVRNVISSSIYKRVLTLRTSSFMKTTAGQVINLVGNDASKCDELCIFGHYLWNAPLEALIVFGLIWNQIGIPTLFAYAILILLIPLQVIFSRKFASFRSNTAQWTDKRVKVVNEIVTGCQIVKMYGWEKPLEDVVHNTRETEFKSIRRASRIRACNLAKRIDNFMNLSKDAVNEKDTDSTHGKDALPGTVLMNKASFCWEQSCLLKDIDLQVKHGSLVGVIGSIGSCKSSLLMAILGEMKLVSGTSCCNGTFAYASQTPWIFADTIRENILFGKPLNPERYAQVIQICCLIPDIDSMTAGDLTVIGEKGVNLSGGQKARISLARAVYDEADIYLFDDPLAAVDSTVAQSIFEDCIGPDGFLKTKSRILVTHQIEYLPKADHCVLLHHGRVEGQGHFNDLLASAEEVKLLYDLRRIQFDRAAQKRKHVDTVEERAATESVAKPDEHGIVKEEVSAGGNISAGVWIKLFTANHGWIGFVPLVIVMFLGEALYDATNRWLSIWASKSFAHQRDHHYPIVFLSLVVATLVIALFRADYFYFVLLRGASVLHNEMLRGVLYTSLRFHESNPVGRILNRFSKDQQVIDEQLPQTFVDSSQSLIMTLGTIVIIGIVNPWVLFILIPLIPSFIWLRRFFLRSSRQTKRLDSVTRSPIYALFSSSLSGLVTIRAFKAEDNFINSFVEKIDANTRAWFVLSAGVRWFGVRLDLMTSALSTLMAILSVALRHHINASSAALGLLYCINMSSMFQWAVRQSAETENNMTSAERIYEYSRLPPEPDFYNEKQKPPLEWPTKGKIEFKNYKFRYRAELEPVLKGINLSIESCDKVGICGRTGAGKSSIFQALFRLVEKSSTEGQICIDDIDINTIGLSDLRAHLNIIPQSPVLFSNTLRYNLDPFSKHSDEELWTALAMVQLKDTISKITDGLSTQVAEYGSNFSVGECQLICVARALLKPSKILLIDEATANVDMNTDKLIQQVIREKFSTQTVLTIAHRLDTIQDSDKIVLINDGLVKAYGKPKDVLFDTKLNDIGLDDADEKEKGTL